MRILDKYEDYYDYLQYVYHDFTFTFDRTGSEALSRQWLLEQVTWHKYWKESYIGDWDFLLLQDCMTRNIDILEEKDINPNLTMSKNR